MKIKINRVNQAVHFVAQNTTDSEVHIDGVESIGGQNLGMRPMELLLTAFATCSALDVVEILKKQRQELIDMEIEVEGQRHEVEKTNPFKSIDIKFNLKGNIDRNKAERAVALATKDYCSVRASMDPNIEVNHKVVIN